VVAPWPGSGWIANLGGGGRRGWEVRALLIWSRSDARRRIGTLVGLALLIALAGGATLTSLAGARRSASAYDRLRARTLAMDAAVFGDEVTMRAATSDSHVAASSAFGMAGINAVKFPNLFPFVVPESDAIGHTIERPIILEGRRAHQNDPFEIVLPEGVARRTHLGIGDRMRFTSVRPEDAAAAETGHAKPNGPRFTLRVVGISRSAAGIAVRDQDIQFMFLTRGWATQFGPRVGLVGNGTIVRLRGGSAAFGAWSRAVNPGGDPAAHPTPLFSPAPVQDSISVIVDGLRLFALIAAIAGLVAVMQAVERHAAGSGDDLDVLRDLGVARRGRATAVFLSVVPALLAGAMGALVLAFAWSPFMPIGLARRAEPDHGWSFDGLVLGLGVPILLVVVLLVAAVVSWRIAARQPSVARVGGRARSAALTRALPPVAATGVQLATTRGHGRNLVPIRSAMAGIAVAIAGVIAVSVFATGLHRLVDEPGRYGVPWDATAFRGRRPSATADARKLARIPEVGAVAIVHAQLDGLLDGRADGSGFALTPVRGHIGAVVRSGRAPAAPGEIAVGLDTAHRLRVHRGDHLRLTGADGSQRMTVVGEALLPTIDDPATLASGFLVVPATAKDLGLATNDAFTRAVVTFRPGVSHRDGIRALRAAGFDVTTPAPPPEVARLREVESLPRALAMILALIGAVVVVLTLIVTVRRRRHDLALLRVLGFTRRQVVGSVLVQSAVVAAIGLVIGIPIGLLLGRYVWQHIAVALGVAPDPVLAVTAVVATAVGAFAVAAASATMPALRAARLRPAQILREE
jgi:FtsX-like permease family